MPEVTVDGNVRLPDLCLSCGNEAGIAWVQMVARARLIGGYPLGAMVIACVGASAIQLLGGSGTWSVAWVALVLFVLVNSRMKGRAERTLDIPLCVACRGDARRSSAWGTAAAIPLAIAVANIVRSKDPVHWPTYALLGIGIGLTTVAVRVDMRSKCRFEFSYVDETFVMKIPDERVAERVRAAAAEAESTGEEGATAAGKDGLSP